MTEFAPLSRKDYAERFGPTAGDRIRLADTKLKIRIEEDWAGGPGRSGNEMIFGGGKVIRESMGQSSTPRDWCHVNPPDPADDHESCIPTGLTTPSGKVKPPFGVMRPAGTAGPLDVPVYPGALGPPDTVITGAVVLDHWGVVKADVAIRGGYIAALGKAYNPETMDAVNWPQSVVAGRPAPENFVIGPETEVISGNGKILTAGGIDTHVHFTCPEQVVEALSAGVTTLIGGGTGPAAGTTATTVTPGAWHLARTFEALDAFPVNVGLLGKGSTTSRESMYHQVNAGVIGFKIHEDWGATPEVIRTCLDVCEEAGIRVQLALHADTLNEAGFYEDTVEAIDGRSVHVFHVEGAGGGHAPDMIKMVFHLNVLPASTNPSRPLTVNTVKEHFDMLMVAHHLNPKIENDLAFAESRIRPSTMAAEDVLHDMGAISIMSSDSHAMGRIGEMIIRTWQTADVMKGRLDFLPQDETANTEAGDEADNHRARRYVAKYTINPAAAHGIDKYVGSVDTGKLADLVLWEPKFFGVKPHQVIKGGQIAYAQLGDANASITTPQPVLPRAVWGATGLAPRSNSFNFVTERAIENGLKDRLALGKEFMPISDTRTVDKDQMKENDHRPKVEVGPKSFNVYIGEGAVRDVETAVPAPTGYDYPLYPVDENAEIPTGDAKFPEDPHRDSNTENPYLPPLRPIAPPPDELPMAQRYFLF